MKTQPNTLVIDIGGTSIKLIVLNQRKKALTQYLRVQTPRPASLQRVLHAITDLLKVADHDFDRIAVGFPGVVEQGVIKTAPNMCSSWIDFNLAQQLSTDFNAPAQVINDADLLGYGLMKGWGVELVITLGTGLGSALFTDGHLVPNLELAHHPFDANFTYEQRLGKQAFEELGVKAWKQHLAAAIELWQRTFNYRQLYLTGGNAASIDIDLPPCVKVVDQIDGLRGGVELWEVSQHLT